MRLADAVGFDQYNVLMSLDEVQPAQLLDLAALEAIGEVIVELVHCFYYREPRQPGNRALHAHVASSGFLAQQSLKEIAIVHFFPGGLLGCGAIALCHER